MRKIALVGGSDIFLNFLKLAFDGEIEKWRPLWDFRCDAWRIAAEVPIIKTTIYPEVSFSAEIDAIKDLFIKDKYIVRPSITNPAINEVVQKFIQNK